jgi:hypothetical protein
MRHWLMLAASSVLLVPVLAPAFDHSAAAPQQRRGIFSGFLHRAEERSYRADYRARDPVFARVERSFRSVGNLDDFFRSYGGRPRTLSAQEVAEVRRLMDFNGFGAPLRRGARSDASPWPLIIPAQESSFALEPFLVPEAATSEQVRDAYAFILRYAPAIWPIVRADMPAAAIILIVAEIAVQCGQTRACSSIVIDTFRVAPQGEASSKAGAQPPGDCTPEQHRVLQQKVDDSCGVKRSCTQDISDCAELNRRLMLNQSCMTARIRINSVCFKGGDTGHAQAYIDAQNAYQQCFSMMSKMRPQCVPIGLR